MEKKQFYLKSHRVGNGITSRRFQFFLAYTVCYLITASAIFSIFLIEKKSFVWVPDGLQQHFNALLYYRAWLREILSTLIREHRLAIPLWDIHIGMGSDVLTTLHYYVIGDPLNLLSVFVPDEKYMEAFYNGMILVRIYLAGLAFAAYCRFHRQSPYATLLGAMVYDFCYWVIVAVRHPYFLNPMIYLPLILIGMDQIYKKKKPWLYIGMLALATISSFYFAYMICIFIIVYAVLRYFMQYHKLVIKKDVISWIGKFLLYSVISLLIASVILIPVAMMTLSTGRANTSTYLPILYSPSYYAKLFVGFLIGGSSHWSKLGYTGLEILTLFILLMNRNRFRGLKLIFGFMTLLLLVPFAGHLLNGGSYAVNRFMWAYSMMISFVAVKMYPSLVEIQKKKKRWLFGGSMLYVVLCLGIYLFMQKIYILVALILFLVMLLMIVATSKKQKESMWFKRTFLALVLCQLIYQGWVEYSPNAGDYVSEFANQGEALAMLTTDTAGSLVADLNPDDDYRYESSHDAELKNTAMQLGINGVSYYFSLANPYINQFQREMYINQTRDFCYSGFDGRTILDELAGVKYYVVMKSEQAFLPYQYQVKVKEETLGTNSENEETYLAYMNETPLSMGFTSSHYILDSEYEKLTVTEKQQALLQGIVVNEEALQSAVEKAIAPAQIEFNDERISYTVTGEDGLKFDNQRIEVEEKGATLTLSLDGLPESETYLIFHSLDYTSKTGSKTRVHIDVTSDEVSKQITYLSKQNNFYSGVDNILVNLGYRTGAVDCITLKFKEKGTYSFDTLEVVCQPVENMAEQVQQLREEMLTDITFSTNQVSGSLTLAEGKLLCMSLPYSTGWTAYLDGKETEIMQADTMYMAIYVPEGAHAITFVYKTPYVRAGAALTAAGFVLLLGLVLFYRRKKKKEVGA